MKKTLFLLFVFLMTSTFAFSNCVWSPQVLYGTGNGSLLATTFWNYSFGQAIYRANEMQLPSAKISGISFLKGNTNNTDDDLTSDFEIWLGCISKEAFEDVNDLVPESSLVKVYDGVVHHPQDSGTWLQILFDTPFFYDGESNLLVYMVYKSGYYRVAVNPVRYVRDSKTENVRFCVYCDDCGFVREGAYSSDALISIDGYRSVVKFYYEDYEDYGISVGDVKVTSDNAEQVDASCIVDGCISFDSETNTLTLDNVQLTDTGGIYAKDFTRADLTINIVGDCNIPDLRCCRGVNTIITGEKSAILNSNQIVVKASDHPVTLVVDNINVKVHEPSDGFQYGIYGYGNEIIVFNECHTEVRTTLCPVDEFANIVFVGCHIEYPVGAVVENGCIRVNGSHDIDTVCIERDYEPSSIENIETTEFSVIPNPAADIITLSGVTLNAEGYLTLTDASGRTMVAIKVPANQADYTMDVTNLTPGIYYLTITSGKRRYTSKVIKK